MRILIVGINYSPEQIGIGPYTSELATFLAAAGYSVAAVAAKPYYPNWKVAPEFRSLGYLRRIEGGIDLTRCPLYVPAKPTGVRRILHHLSFAAAAFFPVLSAALRNRPDLIIAVAPSLMTAPLARLAARLVGAKTWLHVQDFEVEAAIVTGLVSGTSWLSKLAIAFQSFALAGFDRYSSISRQMCVKLEALARVREDVIEFRNWADISQVFPGTAVSPYRTAWNLAERQIALYSGNIANKQGIDIIVRAARHLADRKDLAFVICGDGPELPKLMESAKDLPNVHFHPLQPREKLHDLLSLATVHLLPQLQGAADLVLPSKLTNMLASGRPVVATAQPGTGLALEVEGCGLVTPPGDCKAFAQAITAILSSTELQSRYGRAARQRAEERWSKHAILARVEHEIMQAIGDSLIEVGIQQEVPLQPLNIG